MLNDAASSFGVESVGRLWPPLGGACEGSHLFEVGLIQPLQGAQVSRAKELPGIELIRVLVYS